MRLTLRTLLAYLDDILEPAQARELGEKIQESPFASSLVSRIQEVVRRRRIGAPEVSGRNSRPDPNVVAEYLDNTLPANLVNEMEQVCLESDQHLAEVAACHQVLTLVLGKPVNVPNEMREHMYSLGAVTPPQEDGAGNGVPKHTPKVSGVGAADVNRDVTPQSGEQDLLDHPVGRSRRGSWKRVLPYAIGALVLGIWGYTVFTDFASDQQFIAQQAPELTEEDVPAEGIAGGDDSPDGDGSANVDEATPSEELAGVDSQEGLPSDEPIEVEMQEDEEFAGGVPPAPIPADEETAVADGTDAESATNKDADADATASTDEPLPADDALAKAEPTDGAPAPEEAATPSAPVEPAAPALEPFDVQYVSIEGVLLHFDRAADQWDVMPRRAMVFPGEELAAPEPFTAQFTISDEVEVGEVVLRSGTRVRLLDPTEETRFGMEIDRGRVVLSRRGSEPVEEPLAIRLQVRDQQWRCELVDPETVFGIEVVPGTPQSMGDVESGSKFSGGVSVRTGSVRLTNLATEQAVELQPHSGRLAFTGDPDAPLAEVQSTLGELNWLQDQGPSTRLARHYATKYEKEFLPDQTAAASIRPVVKSSQPRMSELATETLALTGNVSGLVDALSADHQESRIAAIEGLQAWLPRDPQNGEELKSRLQNRFREDAVAAMERMLWGYTQDDARNKLTSQELVGWLSHDELPVRELAAYHIHRLTSRDYGYRADRRADEREAVIKRWQAQLDKSGALLSAE